MGSHEFFEQGDEILEHGGQVMLDGAGMIPGAGEAVDAGQAEYHSLEGMQDAVDGNWRGAAKEEAEAALHAIKAVPGAHELFEIPDYIEAGHDVLEMVTGGDTPIAPSARAGMDRSMGIERSPWTGERTNAPLVSPEVQQLAFGHWAQ
jgi:hypothetical protein